MTIDEIRELIRVFHESGIAELEVQRGENRVRIRGTSGGSHEVVVPTVLPVSLNLAGQPATQPLAAEPPATLPPAETAPAAPKESDRDFLVKSPIVGTYYDSPAPGTPAFVRLGDSVQPKQVLCIIESMKLMNEIEADVAGTIVAKLVDNGRPVEYGEPLFTIRPL